jgi:hypothetical protein
MAQGIEAQIASALLRRLQDLTLTPPLPVAYPDVDFTPPHSGMWLEAQMFPAPTEAVDIAHDGFNNYTGFLQVTVVAPEAGGALPPLEVAAQIMRWFRRGTVMEDGAATVTIFKPPYASPTLQDRATTRTPVTIRYQAFAKQEN